MKKIIFFFIILAETCLSHRLFAQLDGVFVEVYYISDEDDATDVDGGGLEVGSKTYRIYLDLAAGAVLTEIFGDLSHPFVIKSDENFFNNSEGKSFGYLMPRVSYDQNTFALDSYLTLGQTGFQGPNLFFGIPKDQDTNGSFIGGINNDGGSAMIASGLLNNNHPEAGIPLTTADGMVVSNQTPSGWFSYGVVDFQSGVDNTIFGSLNAGNEFNSVNFILRNSGVKGAIDETNQVLVAQLTTKGNLELKLNAKILYDMGNGPILYEYVSTNTITAPNQIFSTSLNYPLTCGCTDPDFLEFDANFGCSNDDLCNTPVVIGCMDTLACNFDPLANFNLQALCCYPGFCAERDLEQVCPHLKGNDFDFKIYPNPAKNLVTINILNGVVTTMEYFIYDYYGQIVIAKTIENAPNNYTESFSIESLTSGLYRVVVKGVNGIQSNYLVKL